MICVVVKGPTFEDAYDQIQTALGLADLVELRLDYFSEINTEALKKLRAHFTIPMIFTLRGRKPENDCSQSEKARLQTLLSLASLEPEYLDLESHLPSTFIEAIALQYPNIKMILSYHNFNETPNNVELERLFLTMQQPHAHFYKMAVTANTSLDALRFLIWAKKKAGKLIATSMGSLGQISRTLAPFIGSPITYASLEETAPVAPGQLSATQLISQYRYHSLSPQTALYGLIGDPVDTSVSDQTHNAAFKAFLIDAIYLKMQVTSSELSEFLNLAKELPFKGLSVTMPLKEDIVPYLDRIDTEAQAIGAVNTLLLKDNQWLGFNTDGVGALRAIEEEISVHGKHIAIIGAGGAARAIAYESNQRGAQLTIVNRDEMKAKALAANFGCAWKCLDQTTSFETVDILINCTPLTMPISEEMIHPTLCVMDIKTHPVEMPFLRCARKQGCRIIYGYQMFIEQALGQYQLWFLDEVPLSINYKESLTKQVKLALHLHTHLSTSFISLPA